MLSREVFKSPSLEVLKSHIDVALRDMDSGGVGSAGLAAGLDDLKSLFQSKLFYNFMIKYAIFIQWV